MSTTDRLPVFRLSFFWLLFAVLDNVQPLDNGLAVTPAMGWNTWNKYGCSINEDIVIKAAKAIKAHGLHKLGYKYINIDDCWQAPNRGPGNIPLADPQKFPRGIKDLADQIHGMGLKLGIYSDAGTYTCGKRYGSLGYETVDAKAYAEWGVDYLKYDNCYNEGLSGTPQLSATRYRTMRDALNATGRPILYSICQWGEDNVWNWGWTIANSWRMSGDIYDNFDRFDDRCPCQDSLTYCALPGMTCSVMNILEKAAGLGQKASPGGWNDLDMLEVGNGGMTYDEYVTHFSMWAITKSPLILGNDVTNMSKETLSIISNKEIIAISQDKNSGAGSRIWKKEYKEKNQGNLQLWKTGYDNGAYAMAFINATPKNLTYVVPFADFFFDFTPDINADWEIKDLWNVNRTIKVIKNDIENFEKEGEINLFRIQEEVGDKVDEGKINTGKKKKKNKVGKGVLLENVPAHGVRVLKFTHPKTDRIEML